MEPVKQVGRQSLEPVGLLHSLREWVRSRALHGNFEVKGLWNFDCIYQPHPLERRFTYRVIVAQTVGQGAAYYSGSPIAWELLSSLVGQKYELEPTAHIALDVALLDSIAGTVTREPHFECYLYGRSEKKARERARLIASEASFLRPLVSTPRAIRVCNIGVVGFIVEELLRLGFEVSASDLEPSVVDTLLFDRVLVRSGSETLRLVEESDIAIVTGMTLANGSLGPIFEAAKAAGTIVILFAQTGSGCAEFLLECGASCVIAEPFPFYIFDGTSSLRVFRKS